MLRSGQSQPLLSSCVEQFLLFKASEGLAARTLAWYREQLSAFVAYVTDRAVVDVKPADVALWLLEGRGRGLAPATVEGRYRALSAFFGWCESAEEVGGPSSPIGYGQRKRVKRPKVPAPALEYVTYAEYRQVVEAIDLATWLDYRDWCLLGVLYWSGLRRGEVVGLDTSDVDLARGLVLVRHGKGDKARVVPVVEEVVSGLVSYLAMRPAYPGSALWLALDRARVGIGGRLTACGLRQMLMRRCRRAQVRYLHPHSWRHGFAMGVLNAGAEMSSVAAMMGHSSVRVTESVYARWLVDGLRREYASAAARIRGEAYAQMSATPD